MGIFRKQLRLGSDARSQVLVSPNDDAQQDNVGESNNLVSLGLAHLTEVQRTGLRDDVLAGFYRNDTHEVFPGVHLGPEDLLVDVGCGSGGVLEFCQRYAGKIIALDISTDAISTAQSRTELANSENLSFISASAEQLPIVTNTATKVLCLEVLEHVDNPVVVLAELFRIGKPGCVYLITVPGQFSELMIKQVAPQEVWEKPHHIRIFSSNDFRSLVQGSGLKILTEAGSGSFSTFFVALFWKRFGTQPREASGAANTDWGHQDPLLKDWAQAWSYLLDLPNGVDIKLMLDSLLPKSQIIVAVKADTQTDNSSQ